MFLLSEKIGEKHALAKGGGFYVEDDKFQPQTVLWVYQQVFSRFPPRVKLGDLTLPGEGLLTARDQTFRTSFWAVP
jgi:hypothetical protein